MQYGAGIPKMTHVASAECHLTVRRFSCTPVQLDVGFDCNISKHWTTAPCPDCKVPGDDCPLIWGMYNPSPAWVPFPFNVHHHRCLHYIARIYVCNRLTSFVNLLFVGQCTHHFHMHCILKWVQSQQAQQHCPICRQEWKFKE